MNRAKVRSLGDLWIIPVLFVAPIAGLALGPFLAVPVAVGWLYDAAWVKSIDDGWEDRHAWAQLCVIGSFFGVFVYAAAAIEWVAA